MSNEQLAVNAVKALAMDGVQAANSGHPGAPMGMADMATVLWTRFLVVDPADPTGNTWLIAQPAMPATRRQVSRAARRPGTPVRGAGRPWPRDP